jgi:uncharacterized delta-60 repeat protein
LEDRSLLSFGTGGIVTTSVTGYDTALAVAIQPADQKIVAAGYMLAPNGAENAFGVARYTTSGSLDTSFNGAGYASTTFNSASTDYGDTADAVALQANGAIVLGGQAFTWNTKLGHYQSTFALARWKPDGTLDSSFGKGGKVTTSFGTNQSNVENLAITSTGKILAMGSDIYTGTHVALARYNTNGSLDTTFGTSGTTLLDVKVSIGGTQYDFSPSAGAVEADGSILMTGSAGGQAVLAHFTANGALDTSFGTGGVVTTAVGTNAVGSSIAMETDGTAVVAGYTVVGGSYETLVIRYNSDGSLDSNFGGGAGYVTTSSWSTSVNGLLIQPNGQIVVLGTGLTFVVLRFNTDGSLDSGFGTGGIVTTTIPGTTRSASDGVAIQSDGKLVVGGQGTYYDAQGHKREEIALVRYNTDGSLDSSSTPSPGGSSQGPIALDYALEALTDE